MQINLKLNNLSYLYIIFFSCVLFIISILLTPLKANTFKISDLEISEAFELNFDKEKVIDKGFRIAFSELISMVTTSEDKKKIEKIKISSIKRLIDSFTMKDERFVNNEYFVKFDVNFNKKNTLDFFEKNNIFPSMPQSKNVLLIPVLVDLQQDEIFLFDKNVVYEKWNEKNKRFYQLNYLLPSEDIEHVKLLNQNRISIEDYDFKKIIERYDLKDFIIIIIYKNNNDLTVLSKIKLNQSLKIDNKKFKKINFDKNKDIDLVIDELKVTYENHWKDINKINTSIKLPITISLNSKDNKKIQKFEDVLQKLDLVSSYEISNFDNKNIIFKIIYNGSPTSLLNSMKENEIMILTNNQSWEIK